MVDFNVDLQILSNIIIMIYLEQQQDIKPHSHCWRHRGRFIVEYMRKQTTKVFKGCQYQVYLKQHHQFWYQSFNIYYWQMIKSIIRTIANFSKQQEQKILDPTDYYNNRKQSLSNLINYPYNFKTTKSIHDYNTTYRDHLKTNVESLAGRIVGIRKHGKLSFVDIKQNSEKVQVAIEKMDSNIKRGDIIGVKGQPFRTHKGELTLKAEQVLLLAPCFHMLPQEENLKDVETKYRKKYLDLIINKDANQKLKIRTKAIQFMRNYFIQKEFLQVQTPSLSVSAGGAIAKPFETYLHEMDLNLYMRIAPQLYLKQLLVGGIPKVFEIGKNFRNQGIDPTHNPEFTSLELYETYKNYEDMMDMTEDLFKNLVKEVTGSYELKVGETTIDFSKPWKRISFINGLQEATNTKFPSQFQSEDSVNFLDSLCKQHKIQCAHPRTPARLLDKLSSHFIQNSASPLFIYKYPGCMSPLAKPCQSNKELTERFQGFINGWQICNSYTQLNDPVLQLKNTPKDRDFVQCLQYGLAPCAGWGLGIDRLIMLLTNSSTIQEVIAFPLIKRSGEK